MMHIVITCCSDEAERLTAIDWAGAGRGPVGEDAGLLVGVAILYNEVNAAERGALDRLAFASYVRGLREANWQGEERLAHMSYHAVMALKVVIGYLPGYLGTWLDTSWYTAHEQHTGASIEAYADSWADATRWLLDHGEAALDLVAHGP